MGQRSRGSLPDQLLGKQWHRLDDRNAGQYAKYSTDDRTDQSRVPSLESVCAQQRSDEDSAQDGKFRQHETKLEIVTGDQDILLTHKSPTRRQFWSDASGGARPEWIKQPSVCVS